MSSESTKIFDIESKASETKIEGGLQQSTTTRVFKDGRARDAKGRFGADRLLEAVGEPKWEKQWTLKVFGYEIGDISISVSRKGVGFSAATAKAEVQVFEQLKGASLGDVVAHSNSDTIQKINEKLGELGFDTKKLTIKEITVEGPGAEIGGSIGNSIEKIGASVSAQATAVKVTLNFEHFGGNSEISFKLAAGAGAGKSVVRAKKDPKNIGSKNEQTIKLAALEVGFKGDLPQALLDKFPPTLRSALESEQQKQKLLENSSSVSNLSQQQEMTSSSTLPISSSSSSSSSTISTSTTTSSSIPSNSNNPAKVQTTNAQSNPSGFTGFIVQYYAPSLSHFSVGHYSLTAVKDGQPVGYWSHHPVKSLPHAPGKLQTEAQDKITYPDGPRSQTYIAASPASVDAAVKRIDSQTQAPDWNFLNQQCVYTVGWILKAASAADPANAGLKAASDLIESKNKQAESLGEVAKTSAKVPVLPVLPVSALAAGGLVGTPSATQKSLDKIAEKHDSITLVTPQSQKSSTQPTAEPASSNPPASANKFHHPSDKAPSTYIVPSNLGFELPRSTAGQPTASSTYIVPSNLGFELPRSSTEQPTPYAVPSNLFGNSEIQSTLPGPVSHECTPPDSISSFLPEEIRRINENCK